MVVVDHTIERGSPTDAPPLAPAIGRSSAALDAYVHVDVDVDDEHPDSRRWILSGSCPGDPRRGLPRVPHVHLVTSPLIPTGRST
jgi:hypothetical protein